MSDDEALSEMSVEEFREVVDTATEDVVESVRRRIEDEMYYGTPLTDEEREELEDVDGVDESVDEWLEEGDADDDLPDAIRFLAEADEVTHEETGKTWEGPEDERTMHTAADEIDLVVEEDSDSMAIPIEEVDFSIDHDSLSTDVIESALDDEDNDFIAGKGHVAEAIRRMADFEDEMFADMPFRATLARNNDPASRMFGSVEMTDDVPDGYDEETFTTHEIEVSQDLSRKLLDRIADAVEKRERQGFEVTQLVLGIPQYKAVDAWAKHNYNQDAEYVLPVEEVIVVPGPMIHPVIDNKRLLIENLDDE